ncbi:MAG: hypothetical protein E4H46_00875 [Desulfobacterales bacterium]|nr:MAG: hypothetical protein E4H46_00875 [Desulfobacterales bacterium]
MRTLICFSCRRVMPANPRVKNQRYCGKDVCQRERKRKWRQATKWPLMLITGPTSMSESLVRA